MLRHDMSPLIRPFGNTILTKVIGPRFLLQVQS